MKKALICGVSGQDGSYLAQYLLERDYIIYGASRDAQASAFSNLKKLGIKDKINLISLNTNDFINTLECITKIKPDEIYNLAGQSSVRLSFHQPHETYESISTGNLNLLEAVRFSNLPIKIYNAGSSECFGDSLIPSNESTIFHPRSPYAIAKAAAFWQIDNYREAYNIFACTGILFNHESPLRPDHFVTKKIVAAACRIYNDKSKKLSLGNINIERDWGWAPEYVEAMWLMMQQDTPQDYIIATGKSHTLKEFINRTFNSLDLDWEEHVLIDEVLRRPTDLQIGRADPSKANRELNWKAKYDLNMIIERMIEDELSQIDHSLANVNKTLSIH
ncbi:MAG TPA: GDP-mannose 4,6-dehydratase [Sphingobacteriaceae bacterium]